MKSYGIFDILGPIMIGPSSSHTAGAARLAKVAVSIAGDEICKVKFVLHGSFAKTYKGHGTDRALVAGVLGMDPWDARIKNSFAYAAEKRIRYEFIEEDLGEVHPNTIKFIMTRADGKEVTVIGSSVGGGSIRIFDIDGQPVEFTGEYTTLIINHKDVPGMVSKVSTILYEENINIAFMKVFRNSRGLKAVTAFETDSSVPKRVLKKIRELDEIQSVKVLKPLQGGE